ncbi:protein toll-like [Cydia amplana]|uniref:protein toll-like n=1 Tax=Cydia amplana TaxID=1869771 RepID=UPI002FE6AF99
MKYLWKKLLVQVAMLVCLVTTSESEAVLIHPKCKTAANCREQANQSGTKYYYDVKGSIGQNAKQQVKVEWEMEKKALSICCNCRPGSHGLAVDDTALPAMPRPTVIKSLEFVGCLVPNVSYNDAIKALNITFSCNDCDLKLFALPAEPRLEGYHLKGLVLNKLTITGLSENSATRPKKDFLNELKELKNLELKDGVELEEEIQTLLPKSLEALLLFNTHLLLPPPVNATEKHNQSHWLQRLPSLKYLRIAEKNTKLLKRPVVLPPLAYFPKLNTLLLMDILLAPIPDNVKWLKDSNLRNLMIMDCGLEKIPHDFFEGANITRIYLKNTTLGSLPDDVFAPLESSLHELDLSHNQLKGRDLVRAVQSLKQLKILKVNNNPLGSLCGSGQYYYKVESGLPKNLRRLELRNTNATRICSDWTENDCLTEIFLDKNNIQFLWYSNLKMRRAENKPVKLSMKNNNNNKNPLQIIINKSDFDQCRNESLSRNGGTRKRVQVNLILNSLACDCNAYWLRELLRSCSLFTPEEPNHVKCTTPSGLAELLDHDPQSLTCSYNGPCPTGCSCVKRQPDNATVVRCAGALPPAPSWPPGTPGYPVALHVAPGTLTAVPRLKLVELHAPNNKITNIYKEDIPDTLRVLDVRNNSIARITSAAAKTLLNLSKHVDYKVSLAGNPLACECEDEYAIASLQRAKITDWNTTQCVDRHYVVDKRKLCNDKMLPTSLGVIGALFILTLTALFFLCLRPRINQFLFNHGMCLKYVLKVKDDADDPMKTHDVFISYAYKDLEFAKKLIEKLERYGNTTIEHCRDWLPGETVIRQITDSVMRARRTLLLVSDNYAESKWALEEFHAAHAHAMEHGSARVIVVLCELQSLKKLPEELQLYLKHNTYLDWSDHYFWDKLRRVMPQPRVVPSSVIEQSLHDKPVPPSQEIIADPALLLSRLSLDNDLPLSKLVLVAPVHQSHDSPQESSAKDSPVTPVVTEPPQLGINDRASFCSVNVSTLPSNILRELPAPVFHVAVPSAC